MLQTNVVCLSAQTIFHQVDPEIPEGNNLLPSTRALQRHGNGPFAVIISKYVSAPKLGHFTFPRIYPILLERWEHFSWDILSLWLSHLHFDELINEEEISAQNMLFY